MNNMQFDDVLKFREIVSSINKELHYKGLFSIEYMLSNNDPYDVMEFLSGHSDYYNVIISDTFECGASFYEIFENYCSSVINYYKSLMIKNSDEKLYYDKTKEPSTIVYPVSDVNMVKEDIGKTLSLMREAINTYYDAYHNRILVAELTTKDPSVSDYFDFEIKERELLHLLGVSAKQLRNNPDFIRLTGNKYMSSIDILEWIMKDINGNNDIKQFNEDFLKRIAANSYMIAEIQHSPNIQTKLLNYHKVRLKSQAFLKYGPLSEVSIVAKLNKPLTKYSKSDTVSISQAKGFNRYPWTYIGEVNNGNTSYVETLLIDDAQGKANTLAGATPAIIKGIYSTSADGSGSPRQIVFNEEEQFNLFVDAFNAFNGIMNFTNLINYFKNVSMGGNSVNKSPNRGK
ncbi:MAG: hypothetical protein E7159_04895 [Firmicutes bacterium]|nr:hypothetical protein [Bacillota bacterium]